MVNFGPQAASISFAYGVETNDHPSSGSIEVFYNHEVPNVGTSRVVEFDYSGYGTLNCVSTISFKLVSSNPGLELTQATTVRAREMRSDLSQSNSKELNVQVCSSALNEAGALSFLVGATKGSGSQLEAYYAQVENLAIKDGVTYTINPSIEAPYFQPAWEDNSSWAPFYHYSYYINKSIDAVGLYFNDFGFAFPSQDNKYYFKQAAPNDPVFLAVVFSESGININNNRVYIYQQSKPLLNVTPFNPKLRPTKITNRSIDTLTKSFNWSLENPTEFDKAILNFSKQIQNTSNKTINYSFEGDFTPDTRTFFMPTLPKAFAVEFPINATEASITYIDSDQHIGYQDYQKDEFKNSTIKEDEETILKDWTEYQLSANFARSIADQNASSSNSSSNSSSESPVSSLPVAFNSSSVSNSISSSSWATASSSAASSSTGSLYLEQKNVSPSCKLNFSLNSPAANGLWFAGCYSVTRQSVIDPYAVQPATAYARYSEFTLHESRDIGFSIFGGNSVYLYLLDATDGHVLAEGYEKIPLSSLKAGDYVLEITSFNTNYFYLYWELVDFGSRDCAAHIPLGSTHYSSWRPDCISAVRDYVDPYQSGNATSHRTRYFTFDVTEKSDIKFNVVTTSRPYLYLYQGATTAGVPLAQGASLSNQLLEAGTYTLEVTTFGQGDLGSFNVSVALLDPNTLCNQPLFVNQTLSGAFISKCTKQSGYTNSDPYADFSKAYARYYNLELKATSDLIVKLRTEKIYDFYTGAKAINIYTEGDLTTPLATAYTSYSGELQLNKRLTAGRYSLEVLGRAINNYTLYVNQLSETNNCQQAIYLGQYFQGLSFSECPQVLFPVSNSDPYAPQPQNYVSNRYDFTLNDTQAIKVAVAGDLEYTPLALYKSVAEGEPQIVDIFPKVSSYYSRSPSNLQVELGSGNYFVELWVPKSSSPQSFTLSVNPSFSNNCKNHLRFPAKVQGSLTSNCKSQVKPRDYSNYDPYSVNNRGYFYAQSYTLEVPVSGRYQVVLTGDFNPEVYWWPNTVNHNNSTVNKALGKEFTLDLAAGFYSFEITSQSPEVTGPIFVYAK